MNKKTPAAPRYSSMIFQKVWKEGTKENKKKLRGNKILVEEICFFSI